MGLRDFLYPQLEVRLVLARALDVDEAQASQGSLSKQYQECAARITISSRDAQRLNLEEGQLVRDAHRLKGIPVTIINGRYDVVCPPILAWRLHQALPGSKLLIIEEAGHSEGEPGTTAALLEAVAAFE